MGRLITRRLFEEEQKLADYDKLASDYKELQDDYNKMADNRDDFKECYEIMLDKFTALEEFNAVLMQELEIRRKNDDSRKKMNNAVEIVSW